MNEINTRNLTIISGGLIGLIGTILAGSLIPPIQNEELWANQVNSEYYLLSRVLLIFAYIIPLIGFSKISKSLGSSQTIAEYGFYLTLTGTGLAIPLLGIATFVTPTAAELYIQGHVEVMQIINSSYSGLSFVINMIGGIMYLFGTILISASLLRDRKDKFLSVLFVIHGIGLTLGFGLYPLLLLGWTSLIIFGFIWMKDVTRNG